MTAPDATAVAGVAVVTGASRGIGRATALDLAARGLDVVLLARDVARLDEVAARVRGLGRRALVARCDVASEHEVRAACGAALDAFGPPRVVVNNAGVVQRGAIDALSLAEWSRVLDVNLTGTFLVTRAFLPSMRAAGAGRFVQVGSISSTIGTAGASAYNASKWGVVGFTKCLAEELRGSGLQTLAVLPGSVDTDMLVGSGWTPDMAPSDVAATIRFAALEAPDAMNGSCLEIFGD